MPRKRQKTSGSLPPFLTRERNGKISRSKRVMAEILLIVYLHRQRGWGCKAISHHMEARDARAEGREPIPLCGCPDNSVPARLRYLKHANRPWKLRRWSKDRVRLAVHRWWPQLMRLRELDAQNACGQIRVDIHDVIRELRKVPPLPNRYTRAEIEAGIPGWRNLSEGRRSGRQRKIGPDPANLDRRILGALWHLGAIAFEHRQTNVDVAREATGGRRSARSAVAKWSLSSRMVSLVRRGLVASRKGGWGGHWLTPAGVELITAGAEVTVQPPSPTSHERGIPGRHWRSPQERAELAAFKAQATTLAAQ